MHNPARLLAALLVFAAAMPLAADPPESEELAVESYPSNGENCTFRSEPDEFLGRAARALREAYERVLAFSSTKEAAASVEPADVPRRNFIDDEIFLRLQKEGLPAARLTTDEEFLRRVTLDLTGRTPSAAEIRAFAADPAANKRDILIDRLIYSEGFVEKWTMWLGDLLQNAQAAQNRSQQTEGRNRMHEWLRMAVYEGKSLKDIAAEAIVQTGNNYDRSAPGANFVIRSFAPMGPAQDTYDMMLVRTATAFLGLGHYDCLLCHDGRRHVDTISVWAGDAKRLEAHRMASFFSRMRMRGYPTQDRADFYYNSFTVTEAATGQYDLNTTSGNRPRRDPYTIEGRTTTSLAPQYRDGRAAANGNWRNQFAQFMAEDPMFAVNFANRIWKAMFNLALAEPVDQLDPRRLDTKNPPPAGWEMQASHPELLERLAESLRESGFSLQKFVKLIASSSAYQLSSKYDGEWNITNANLFARHIPRRLEAEEAHDAIARSTGVIPSYAVGGWTERVSFALQLPEPTEPRSNGQANGFMNSFNRGNRDTQPRSQSGSILMWLNMMNNGFVNDRIRMQNSPVLKSLALIKDNGLVADEMFLAFLSRSPSAAERTTAVRHLDAAKTDVQRNAAMEDLAWSLINKVDFLFSY
jgi:hypothetical protein